MRSLRSASMGSISAWLPSRRSTLHHTGGLADHARRPGAVGEVDRSKRAVLGGRVDLHGCFLCFLVADVDSRRAPWTARLRAPLVRGERAHCSNWGVGLCARGAQQQQTAKVERAQRRKRRPGDRGGRRNAAHRKNLSQNAPACNLGRGESGIAPLLRGIGLPSVPSGACAVLAPGPRVEPMA